MSSWTLLSWTGPPLPLIEHRVSYIAVPVSLATSRITVWRSKRKKLVENEIEMTIPSTPHFNKRGRLFSQLPQDRRPCVGLWLLKLISSSHSRDACLWLQTPNRNGKLAPAILIRAFYYLIDHIEHYTVFVCTLPDHKPGTKIHVTVSSKLTVR